jgi:UDP-GlcNAc:undecaprenyl-phosphate GlcNAc-1-phosphate transferase
MTIPHVGIIVPALLALTLVLASIPLMKWAGLRYGIVSVPYAATLQERRVSVLGGVSILLAILISLALANALPLWIGGPVFMLFLVGLIDDVMVLRPIMKLALQLIVVVAVLSLAPQFTLTPWRVVNILMAGFFLLSTINAFNLIDGLDGLAGGIGIFAALAIAAIAGQHGDVQALIQSLVIVGALGAFLLFNFQPASIFMGDGGALPLGLLLGIMALHAGFSSPWRLERYLIPILILLVPLLDTFVVIASRCLTCIPISHRGLDHSHHRLLAMGLSPKRAVALCWGMALASAGLAVFLEQLSYPYVISGLPLILAVFAPIGLFMIDLTFDTASPATMYPHLRGLGRLIVPLIYKRRIAEALLDIFVIPAAFFGAFQLRLDFTIDQGRLNAIVYTLPWVIASTYSAFFISGVYRGIWRYIGLSDIARFAYGAMLAGGFIVLVSLVHPLALSRSIAVLYVILLFNMLIASRLSFRAIRKLLARLAGPDLRVIVVGAGTLAENAVNYIASMTPAMCLIGFVDDDRFKLGKLVHGRPVLGSSFDLEVLFHRTRFNQVVIACDQLSNDQVRVLSELAVRHHIMIRRFSIGMSEPLARIIPANVEWSSPTLISIPT